MGDKSDERFNYIKARIDSGFPKLAGAKLDKLLLTDEKKEIILQFCDDETNRCLVVPESMSVDTNIPSKSGKGKCLVFVKLTNCKLTLEEMSTQVSNI